MVVWYYDIIYDLRGLDNEVFSVECVVVELFVLGVSDVFVGQV